MGLLNKSSDGDKNQKRQAALEQAEEKARDKASKKGFDVANAIYVIEAMFPKDDKAKYNLNMPLVAIFPDKVVQSRKAMMGSSLEEIPLKNITSVEITTGLIPVVNVYTSGNTLSFRTDVLNGPRFVEVLRECLANRKDGGHASSQLSDVEQLEKLATLLEKGVLTKEEFDAKKKLILGL